MKINCFLVFTLGLLLLFTLPVLAASYYVKSDGSDSLNGRSDSNAWRTIAKVNDYRFSSGDDVYFKCGGSWVGTQLIVDWNGDPADKVTIGAYHIAGGTEVHGVSGNKPVIDGRNTIPASEWAGLVRVNGDYVSIENLDIRNSAGKGVNFDETTRGDVKNCYIYHCYKEGIHHERCEYGDIEDNEVTEVSRVSVTRIPYSRSIGPTESSHMRIRRNIVHGNYGEGINAFKANDDILIEYNIVYDSRSTGIYVDGSTNITVRYNLVYNTSDKTYWNTSSLPGHGIYVTTEPWCPHDTCENIYVYGNLVAGVVGDSHYPWVNQIPLRMFSCIIILSLTAERTCELETVPLPIVM